MRKSIIFLLIISIVALFVISGCQKEAVGQQISANYNYKLKGTFSNDNKEYSLAQNEGAIMEGNTLWVIDKGSLSGGVVIMGFLSCEGTCNSCMGGDCHSTKCVGSQGAPGGQYICGCACSFDCNPSSNCGWKFYS